MIHKIPTYLSQIFFTRLINTIAISMNVEYKTGELSRTSLSHIKKTCSEAYLDIIELNFLNIKSI
jgi:hypothetical protein